MTASAAGMPAARPQLIRAMNEQVMIDYIRRTGPLSRADLARISGLSKPTVSLALANIERAGLVRAAGHRTGVPGPAAILYEVRPEAGFVLGLDVGREYLRGAVADLAGTIRVKSRRAPRPMTATGGSPSSSHSRRPCCRRRHRGVRHHPDRHRQPRRLRPAARRARTRREPSGLGFAGRARRTACGLRRAVMVENDIDVAAMAERAHGHGRDVDSFAFVSIGTGIGMGLVLGGKLHRGAHGAAGEIGYLPFSEGHGTDVDDARQRGSFEAASSAAAVVRAAKRAGVEDAASAQHVFNAAAAG